MGTFFYPVKFIGPNGREIDVDALVDTGASFSSIPGEQLRELGVTPIRRVRLRLANGQSHIQELGRVRAEINGDEEPTLVVFGEPDSPPAIGAYTLEGLALGVDPVGGRLIPMEGWRG
jgi:aspartyl protease family protein